MGMQETLASRSGGVIGILNGVDYADWDPRHDSHLTVHFGPNDLQGKLINKERLLAAIGLSEPQIPLISMVTRLAEQKGIDLLIDALPQALMERDFGFMILGSGDERYAAFFRDLAARFPSRVVFRSGYDLRSESNV
jgi:starch synthase